MSDCIYNFRVLSTLYVLAFIFHVMVHADVTLEKYVKTNPTDLKAVYKLASSLAKNGNHKKAVKYWRHLASRRKSPKTLYLYARGLYLADTGHEALSICDRISDPTYESKCSKIKTKVQEDFPEHFQLYSSNRLVKEGKYDAAMDSLESLLEDDETDPHYRLAMGRVFHGLKKFDYAHDHYLFVNSQLKNEPAKKAIAKLKSVGQKALKYVKQNKTSVDDDHKFYWRVYLAFKLATEDSEYSFRGLKMRAIEFYREQNEENESFENLYRIAFLQSLQRDKEESKISYDNALNNAEELMYPIVEFLKLQLDTHEDRTEYVLDIMNEVGGEEIYRRLQQAAIAEDKSNASQIAKSANSAMKKIGVSQAQFVAEFENYKRRISNAESKLEQDNLLAEYKKKYGHLLDDPAMKKRLENMLHSGDAKKLKEKYADQLEKLK